MPRLTIAGTALVVLAAVEAIAGQSLKPRLEGQQLVEALKGGGHTILMRHTSTEPVAPDHPLVEDLKRKSFHTSAEFSEEQACSGDFLNRYVRACRAGMPLVEFLSGAMGLKLV